MKYFGLISCLLISICFNSCKKSHAVNPAVTLQKIVVTPDTLNLLLYQQQSFTVSTVPATALDTSFTYKIADSTVATLNSNLLVRALKVGTTYVSISNKSKTVSAKCIINVLPTAVTGLSLSVDSLHMIVGNKDSLQATVVPPNATYQSVLWSSSNTNVATVNATGVIQALSIGVTNITATSSDGKQKAVAKIKVDSLNVLLSSTIVYDLEMLNNNNAEESEFTLTNNSPDYIFLTELDLVDLNGFHYTDVKYSPKALITSGNIFYSGYHSVIFSQYNLPNQLYYFEYYALITCQNKNYRVSIGYSNNGTKKFQTTVQL